MKLYLTLLTILLSLCGRAQEIRVTNVYGYSIARFDDARRILFTSGLTAGIEFASKTDHQLCVVPGMLRSMYSGTDSTGRNVFGTLYFIRLPLTLKKYFHLSQRSRLFLELGPYAGSLAYQKKESWNASGVSVERSYNLGFTGGLTGSIGFRALVTRSWYFDLELVSEKDLFPSYRREKEIRSKRNLLGFSVYKRLK